LNNPEENPGKKDITEELEALEEDEIFNELDLKFVRQSNL
jgi:hypothetical protein